MAGGETCTLSLCVYSAELDTAANGAYCKVYVDGRDHTNGTGSGTSDATSPDPSRSSDNAMGGPRSFHTHVEKSEKKTYLPTWNESFTIDVYDRGNEILTIRLKAKKLLHVSVVGACAIPLHQIPTGQPVDQWFPVQKGGKRRGKLRLKMMLTRAMPTGAMTPQDRVPPSRTSMNSPPQPPYDSQRTGSQRTVDQRSSGGSSLYQRPSSLTSPLSGPNRSLEQRPPTTQDQAQQQQAYGSEPEDEPTKEKSPIKTETIYRPATNPRLDLESDDDDETSFPRVAELHRLESDLIGESSDEEVDARAMMPKSPLYLEPLNEGGNSAGEESLSPSAGRPSSARGSNAIPFDHEDSITLDEFKPQIVEPTQKNDRRTSVEVARQTKVVVPQEDLDRILEQSAVTVSSYDDIEEGIDMAGVASGFDADIDDHHSASHGSTSSDVAVGEVVAPEVVDEVWNRYSSSSSEELDVNENMNGLRSSGSSVHEGIAVSFVEANPFVEPASPNHSSQGDEVDNRRGSYSSDEGARRSWISENVESRITRRDRAVSNSSWVSEHDVGDRAIHNHSSPHTSWVSDRSETHAASSTKAQSSGRDKSWSGTSWISEQDSPSVVATSNDQASSRHSWVSEQSEAHTSGAPSPSAPERLTRRDKSWSGTSWVNENENTSFVDATGPPSSWVSEDDEAKAAAEHTSPRHSWVSDAASEAPARLNGRDKSWSGTSWVNENENSSFVDANGPRSSRVSEDDDSHVGESKSPRHSWVSDAASELPARLTSRDKSYSTTSWVSEAGSESRASRDKSYSTTSWVSEGETESLAQRDKSYSATSWVSEAGPESLAPRDKSYSTTSWVSEGETESLAQRDKSYSTTSWVSEGDSESPARLTGRDKSYSGTSWVSEQDNNSFVDASGHPDHSSRRSSWISENDENPDSFDVAPSPSKTSWVHEDGALPPRRLTARDKSWSGTSWISDHDNTSFVDATALRSSWINDDAEADAANVSFSRNSWVSENGVDSPARSGRDKSWSGTSWISENNMGGPEQPGSPRSSWVSEGPDVAGEDPAVRHSWVSEDAGQAPPRLTGRDKSWSGTSWISEQENTSFVNASGPPQRGSPRSSWISEATAAEVEGSSSSPRHSWVSESTSEAPARLTGRDKSWSGTSWVSEDENTSFSGAGRSHVTESRSSWVSEADSTVNAKPQSPRHSWVSEREHAVHSLRTSWISESGVAVLPAPARDSVEAATPPRTSLLSEVSDIIEAEHRASPRSSISADPTSEPASQADTFVSDRVSSTSSVEVANPQSATNHGSRGSYSSSEGDRYAQHLDASTSRVSMSSERLSMEDDSSSAARVSFVSVDRTTGTSAAFGSDLSSTPPDDVHFARGDTHDHLFEAELQNPSRSSEEGRSSGYERDNIETPTTRSSSQCSEQTRDRDDEVGREDPTHRSSSSSNSDVDEFGPSSYTDLTRHSSISSAGVENIVARDDAELHAEAVAEAARYSSSSEGDFEREDRVDAHAIALKTELHKARRYSSASEEDTVDHNSTAVGYDYDDLSAGRSHSSSAAARDEAQFAAWTEESSANGDFSDAMRRVSQMSATSDMYDASPRGSDLGVIPESHPRASVDSPSSSASLGISEPPTDSTSGIRRFISSVNVLVEPYDDETPRNSISNEIVASAPVVLTTETAKVTVEVLKKEAKPATSNPFVEYGSSSSEEENVELQATTRGSHSSEGDHEVVVVETLEQLDSHEKVGSAIDHVDVEAKSSSVSTTNEKVSVKVEQAPVITVTTTQSVQISTSSAADGSSTRVSFSKEAEAKSEDGIRENVRGDHTLVSMASSLTRAQLQAVAQDYLPSDDESESEFDSDADFNFDSDS